MSSGKRNSIIAVILLVIVGGGFLGKVLLDERLLRKFAELAAKLPGTFTYTEAKADALAKRITLAGVKYAPSNNLLQVAVDRLVLEGWNTDALQHPGTQPVLSVLHAENFTVHVPEALYGQETEVVYKTLTLQDVQADVQAFAAAASGPKPQTEEEVRALLKNLEKPLDEVRFGFMQTSDMTYTFQTPELPFKISTASMHSKDVGLFVSGKSTTQNIVIDASPVVRLSVATMDMDGMRLPNTLGLFGKENLTELDYYNAFKPHMIQVENLNMKAISFAVPLAHKAPITMEEFTANVDFSLPSSFTLATAQKDLVIPAELIAQAFPGFLEYHGKPLNLSFAVDMEYSYDQTTKILGANLRKLLVQEQNLGRFA